MSCSPGCVAPSMSMVAQLTALSEAWSQNDGLKARSQVIERPRIISRLPRSRMSHAVLARPLDHRVEKSPSIAKLAWK
jgi:hypothetical protein